MYSLITLLQLIKWDQMLEISSLPNPLNGFRIAASISQFRGGNSRWILHDKTCNRSLCRMPHARYINSAYIVAFLKGNCISAPRLIRHVTVPRLIIGLFFVASWSARLQRIDKMSLDACWLFQVRRKTNRM